MNVSELTSDHFGWLVEVADEDPVIRHRQFELIDVRTWAFAGEVYVGLTARNTGDLPVTFKGSEQRYVASTQCKLIRRVRKHRRSAPREQPEAN